VHAGRPPSIVAPSAGGVGGGADHPENRILKRHENTLEAAAVAVS
jgi:hypothetical protein